MADHNSVSRSSIDQIMVLSFGRAENGFDRRDDAFEQWSSLEFKNNYSVFVALLSVPLMTLRSLSGDIELSILPTDLFGNTMTYKLGGIAAFFGITNNFRSQGFKYMTMIANTGEFGPILKNTIELKKVSVLILHISDDPPV